LQRRLSWCRGRVNETNIVEEVPLYFSVVGVSLHRTGAGEDVSTKSLRYEWSGPWTTGLSLKPPEFVDFPPSLNAKQVHYLVTHSYIVYSTVALPKDVMDDKNKGDGARCFTICQLGSYRR
jgi:hypothetical protein